jgi:hypothetical protein
MRIRGNPDRTHEDLILRQVVPVMPGNMHCHSSCAPSSRGYRTLADQRAGRTRCSSALAAWLKSEKVGARG